jgi:ribonuclease P protein component
MDFVLACLRSGDVKLSVGVVRRGGNGSLFGFRVSTPAPDQPSRPGFAFPRSYRLTRGVELQNVAKEGKRIRTVYLDVRVLASPLGHPRVGIVVPRYGRSAVDRNRLKRRLRELVRTHLLPEACSVDVVIRTRPDAYSASFDALGLDIARTKTQLTQLYSQ